MRADFKRVPAIDKCFAILDLMAEQKKPLGISQIAGLLALNKSTVFSLVHTLCDLAVLEKQDGKFSFGPKLYLLGKAVNDGSDPVRIIHPYLQEISQKTNLSVFLGMRSGAKAIILDKVDAPIDMKVSTDVGIEVPLLAGAGGKALLAQLPDEEISALLKQKPLPRYTGHSCTNKKQYREIIAKVRRQGIAFDNQEYLEGIVALAVPLDVQRKDLQLALWAVGIKGQLPEAALKDAAELLKGVAQRIAERFLP